MNTRRWDEVRKFEDLYNRKLLRKMNADESFKVLSRLYELGIGLDEKRHKNSINMDHISGILKIKLRLKALSE